MMRILKGLMDSKMSLKGLMDSKMRLKKYRLEFNIYKSINLQKTINSNSKYIWTYQVFKNLRINSFWCRNLQKDSKRLRLFSNVYIVLLKMDGLAKLFMKNVIIKALQLHCLLRSQVDDLEVLLAKSGSKWMETYLMKRPFYFLLTRRKLSLFNSITKITLFIAKMTVVLLSES